MRIVGTILLFCCCTLGFSQNHNKAQKAYDEAENLFYARKFDESLKAFESFVSTYHWSLLVPSAYFNIGQISMRVHQYKKATQIFTDFIEQDFDYTMKQYGDYKHQTARYLAEIALETQQWNDAERYIKMFDQQFPYHDDCGNGWEAYDIYKAAMEARLYEGRGDLKQALSLILPRIFHNPFASNEGAIDVAVDILKRNYKSDEIVRELSAGLEGLHAKARAGLEVYVVTMFGNTIELSPFLFDDVKSVEDVRKIVRENAVFVSFLGN